MENNVDHLRRFIDSIRSIGLFDRIFGWRKIREQLIDASADLQRLLINNETLKENVARLELRNDGLSRDSQSKQEMLIQKGFEIEQLQLVVKDHSAKFGQLQAECSAAEASNKSQDREINKLSSDIALLAEKNTQLIAENKKLSEEAATYVQTNADLGSRRIELDMELAKSRNDWDHLQAELNTLKKENVELIKEESFRKQEHSNALSSLSNIQRQLQDERAKELEERSAREIERIRKLKDTWNQHEVSVKNILKSICQRHTVSYVEKVPFKGNPDNTLMICGEFVVFDAKSPGGEELRNFPNYLKDQAEKAQKYSRQENVKSDIFFVVPSNTLEQLNQFVYRHGDHNVYIVSIDVLEPLVLCLKKVEEYEFAEQLSPEERENICRVLGRFAHLSKRRIQVDSFFAKQFIELAYKCETDLPEEILAGVMEFEKAEKLNPPLEKRAKSIPISEIEREAKQINQEADSRGILLVEKNISESLNALPLYKAVGE